MKTIPKQFKYTKNHEWVTKCGNTFIIGITDHAQKKLGDIVFLELPKQGSKIKENHPFGIIESIKAVSDLIAPISGEILLINEKLISNPEIVNLYPYEKGWILKITQDHINRFNKLMNSEEYLNFLQEIEK
jgi:glycine cleavage system H protein